MCYVPIMLVKMLLIVLWTVLSGVAFMVGVFGILVPVIYLVAPAGFIVGIG